MSDKKSTAYSRQSINEQLSYLQDVYDLLRLYEHGARALEDMPKFRVGCKNRSAKCESVLERDIALDEYLKDAKSELRERIKAFEKELKAKPDKYPIGSFFKKKRLNGFEKHVVTSTVAIAVFGDGSFSEVNSMDIRKLARTYHKSTAKRLEAEFYFDEGCNLVEKGIIELEGGRFHRRRSAVRGLRSEVRITEEAYRAVLGRTAGSEYDQDIDGERRGRVLGELIEPRIRMKNVILPATTLDQISKALAQVQNHELIFEGWGLGKQVTRGRSPSMLFAGPPGTGKTLAAEAIAYALDMKMMLVRGSDVITCWWGQSEKNAARVFRQAKEASAVLVFDEADSYFHRRLHGSRSVDESANRTINTFLGCLETHELPVILTTNRADALDPALERRVSLKVLFDPPGAKERKKIWRLHLPRKMPLAEDVDLRILADKYRLTGGQIKNAAVTAARSAVHRASAAGEDAVVSAEDLEEACRHELQGSELFGNVEREIGFRGKSK